LVLLFFAGAAGWALVLLSLLIAAAVSLLDSDPELGPSLHRALLF
jgi:hypothetical protein